MLKDGESGGLGTVFLYDMGIETMNIQQHGLHAWRLHKEQTHTYTHARIHTHMHACASAHMEKKDMKGGGLLLGKNKGLCGTKR